MTLQMPQADELVLNNKENIILDLKKISSNVLFEN